tara:strand:+ start:296 stop:580 length:285 start_codon:yes stop_codon:yes gene_type:complete
MKNKEIEIEIYFPVNKRIISKSQIVNEGTTLKEFLDEIKLENFDLVDDISFGVFGKIKDLDYILKEFDRVEVFHNASADPKKSRVMRVKKSHKP